MHFHAVHDNVRYTIRFTYNSDIQTCLHSTQIGFADS
jgi:hypothetical protein